MTGSPDVVIIGGGVMGCSALFYLSELGVTSPLLLERATLASGSTGRSMGILRMHYSNEVCVRMAHESRRIIAEFESVTGSPGGFVRTGYLFLVGAGQEEAMRRNLALAQSVGVETTEIALDEARTLFPGFDFTGVAAIAHEPSSGYADTSAITSGFARAARIRGARVRLGVEVAGISLDRGAAVGVITANGERIATGAVVIAAGPWSHELLAGRGAPLPLSWVRHQVLKLHRPLHLLPDHPVVGDLQNGLSFRPDAGDLTLLAIGEEPVARDGYNQAVDADVAADAISRVAARVPAMHEAGWDGGWAGLFTVTPDWHPVIDAVPGIPGLYCAVGFSGHGFKLSPAVGRAVAELVVGGRSTSIDISPLRFTRFAEGAPLRSAYGETVFA